MNAGLRNNFKNAVRLVEGSTRLPAFPSMTFKQITDFKNKNDIIVACRVGVSNRTLAKTAEMLDTRLNASVQLTYIGKINNHVSFKQVN